MNRKSLLKRIKITRTGKIIRRTAGLSHFRSKKSNPKIYAKKRAKLASQKIMKYK
jgi:ribosomal protein L35